MSEEHLRGCSSLSLLQEPKRRRTPSQYAAQIADFKTNHNTIPKKSKTSRPQENEEASEENAKEGANKAMLCVLPSGKKYFVKIVGGTIKNRKVEKPQKNKQLKRQNSSIKVKEEQKKEPNQSFFDKFLMVCEQLQKNSGQDSKEVPQQSKENEEKSPTRRQEKAKKQRERDDRWGKYYERLRVLTERMDKLQANYSFLE